MRTLRQILATALLSFLLVVPAFAGEMGTNGVTATGEIGTNGVTATGEMDTGSTATDGEMSTTATGTADSLTEAALSLLNTVLVLF